MTAIYLLLAIITIVCYIHKHYVGFLVCYLGLISGLWMLDTTGTPASLGGDMCIFVNIVLFLMLLLTRKISFRKRQRDIFSIYIFIYILFYLIELTITVITNNETLLMALKVIRVPFVFLSYYLMRLIPLKSFKRFLKIGLLITLFQGLLFYLQFAGIFLMKGCDEERILKFGFKSALNIPTLSIFYLFYVLKSKYVKHWRYPILFFLLGIVFLTYVRTNILAILIAMFVYLLMNNDRKKRRSLLFITIISIPLAINFISTKSSATSSSLRDDVRWLVQNRGDYSQIDASAGSFTFRMGILAERWDYLLSHPQYLLTGVGTIHEDSPYCYKRFNFMLGTRNEERYNEYCLIESGDIAWSPVLLRYGLTGIVLHVALFVLVFSICRKRRDLLMIIIPLYIYLFIRTFDGAFFESYEMLYLTSLCMAMTYRANYQKEELSV